jgi:predicted HicB family RNase H-like nuclease
MTKKQPVKQSVKQRITVLIDPELACDAKIFALRSKIGLGELVSQALQQALKNNAPTDS